MPRRPQGRGKKGRCAMAQRRIKKAEEEAREYSLVGIIVLVVGTVAISIGIPLLVRSWDSSSPAAVEEEEVSYDFLEPAGGDEPDFRFADQNEIGGDLNEEPDGLPGGMMKAIYHPAVKELPREFMIHTGRGLTSYVPFETAIDIAAQTGIKLYAGRHVREGYEITPGQARRLEKVTDRLQVTAGVVPGDRFTRKGDVWTFHPSPERR